MNQSMTGKHVFLFLLGSATGAALMHFSMKNESKPKVASTAVAGLRYVPEQIKPQY